MASPLLPVSSFYEATDLLRPVVLGTVLYLALYFTFRLLGPRTLAQVSILGFVLSVTTGSLLASEFLSSDVSLVKGALAFATLLALEWLLTRAMTDWPPLRVLFSAQPRLLCYEGVLLNRRVRSSRIMMNDLNSAMRGKGLVSYDKVG